MAKRRAVREEAAQDAAAPRFRIRIDDAAPVSIYEQIIGQIQEAVATGQLRPGDRLPTVRRLADELDIAPGTVALAYGELERLGILVTEVARDRRGFAAKPHTRPDAARRHGSLPRRARQSSPAVAARLPVVDLRRAGRGEDPT